MRYFLVGITMLFTVYTWSQGYRESVAAVSFNPSRTGTYTHLKIARKATLAGLDACQFNGAGCASSAGVEIASNGTVEVVSGCTQSGGNCPSPTITIGTVEPASSSVSTNLETLSKSFVRGTSTATEPTGFNADDPNLDLGVVSNANSSEIAKYVGIGTPINVAKNATLTSKGKTFVGNLIVGAGSNVVLTVQKTGDENPSVNLNAGGVVKIPVDSNITLGGITIPQSLLGTKNFKWQDQGTYKVLGRN